ncbi:MAG: transposase [Clostridia bacterium]|nr:transposase [Clostridia bacterium]
MKNQLSKRKNLRIPEYNYSNQGQYFITICTKDRKCILSKIIKDKQNNFIKLDLLPYGKIVANNLIKTNRIYNDIKISDYIIMPNHIHFICEIVKSDSLRGTNPTKSKIPVLISSLKRLVNKECMGKR